MPGTVRARILAASRTSPPAETGLSHWSSREMAAFITRTEGAYVSHHYVAKLWRDTGLKPHRQGTFKVSKDPAFAEKVADIVGLYLYPPAGAIVLSLDEKTQVQALDRTQPLLPIAFDATEKRTHDYVRHGTTNLFAALNVATGEVLGECRPSRDGGSFLAFLKKAVKPHAGKEVHAVLDNLSTHTTPEVKAWLKKNPNVQFHFTPVVFLDQPDRNLGWHHHPPGDSPRHVQFGTGPHQADPRLHRPLEQQRRTVRVDRHG
jgi:hypothetical protein